jgi:uncharacterized protein YkwD
VVVLALAAALALAVATGASGAPRATLSRPDAALLQVVNEARAAHGLQPLRIDTTLEQAARAHSDEMLSGNYFDHGDFAARLADYGVQAHVAGENLAWGSGSYGTARAILWAWMHSPEHRANLLEPAYSRIGIGAVRGTFEGYTGATVVTADFADN